jgi:hypothetical protein
MSKWYVVSERDSDSNDDQNTSGDLVWTLSRDPRTPGWNTDSGFPGYGLSKTDADELARAANTLDFLRRLICFWR